MKHKLTEKEITAIERALNKPGATETAVKIENGKIVVLQVEKKKIV